MNLTNTQIEDTYGNVLTIGTSAGSPTTGTLQNGAGEDITSLTVKSIKYAQSSVTANGTTISTTALLGYGVSVISATSTNYAVRLPEPSLGGIVGIVNNSSVSIRVFPYDSNDSINLLADGVYYEIPADGALYTFTCTKNPSVGNWSVSTPTQNQTVTKTVSISLTADGTHTDGSESHSAADLLNAAKTTYYPAGSPYYVLDAPSSTVDYFDTAEFNTKNEVRLIKIVVKSNVPAGDLTGNASQISSTLMSITNNQLAQLFGYIRKGTMSADGSSTFTSNLYNTQRYVNAYSNYIHTSTALPVGYGHYMGSDGSLYQQITVDTPNNDWDEINDDNGNRRIYYSPYIGYGNSSYPESGYPSGFEFTAEIVATFEFK